jgi:AraC family transcriptional activator of pobA
MEKNEISSHRFESLSGVHKVLAMPAPLHPLVSLINNADNSVDLNKLPNPHILSFYKISYKKNFHGKIRYGQDFYDFDEGGMFFVSPNQITAHDGQSMDHSGYTLLFHPDFLLGYPLAKKIKEFGFFSYSVNEALHLSEIEKETIISIFKIIETELQSRIDDFSQDVIISQLELLLNYSNRFYKRQFITRKSVNNALLQKMDDILNSYYNTDKSVESGIPSVLYLSEELKVSPGYLSDMLRSLTGLNAQQHIHLKLIDKAKEMLSITSLSVSEIAYLLGFEHPQSFSKLFRLKTKLSPVEFRKSFN